MLKFILVSVCSGTIAFGIARLLLPQSSSHASVTAGFRSGASGSATGSAVPHNGDQPALETPRGPNLPVRNEICSVPSPKSVPADLLARSPVKDVEGLKRLIAAQSKPFDALRTEVHAPLDQRLEAFKGCYYTAAKPTENLRVEIEWYLESTKKAAVAKDFTVRGMEGPQESQKAAFACLEKHLLSPPVEVESKNNRDFIEYAGLYPFPLILNLRPPLRVSPASSDRPPAKADALPDR